MVVFGRRKIENVDRLRNRSTAETLNEALPLASSSKRINSSIRSKALERRAAHQPEKKIRTSSKSSSLGKRTPKSNTFDSSKNIDLQDKDQHASANKSPLRGFPLTDAENVQPSQGHLQDVSSHPIRSSGSPRKKRRKFNKKTCLRSVCLSLSDILQVVFFPIAEKQI